jgi:hypothetical protein
MAGPQKNLSLSDAKRVASEAIRSGAASLKVEKQADGKWTVTAT